MAQPKLSDVAAVAGVSPTTVSRVLNNRGYLSQATRDKVYAAMREIGYHPNAIARSLQGQKSSMVGIIFPSVAHPFYGQIAAEIESRLAVSGYRVLLCNSDDHPERERMHLEMLLSNQVDGIITGAHSDVVATYPKLRAPLVTIDRPNPGQFPNVRCDNYAVSVRVVEGLLERGSVAPIHLTSSATQQGPRQSGYVDAVTAAGLTPSVVRVEHEPRLRENETEVFHSLDALDQVDAVFAGNDVLAATALRWARARGLGVPEQVQVVGFDGADSVRTLLPHLSTVIQPYEAIAERSVNHLLAAIEGRGPLSGPDELPATIHWGSSTR